MPRVTNTTSRQHWGDPGDVAVVVEVETSTRDLARHDISIVISGGRATVRGIVERPEDQDALERFALSLDGVETVENRAQLPTA